MTPITGTFTVVVKPASGGGGTGGGGTGGGTGAEPLAMSPLGGNLPEEEQGVAVSGDEICIISGGTKPYSIQVTQGQMPPGMAVSVDPPAEDGSVTVVLEGTPSQSGVYSFGLTVSDSSGANVRVGA